MTLFFKKILRMHYEKIPLFNKEGGVNVIIETPKGLRNKYAYEEEYGLMELTKTLPAGSAFPFDFGFIPKTLGGDGDPLDVLVIMEEPAFPGCLVNCRILGAIVAEQTEKGNTGRNDRLIAVPEKSITFKDTKSLDDLSKNIVEEIEHFFVSYNQQAGKKFETLKIAGPEEAMNIIESSTNI